MPQSVKTDDFEETTLGALSSHCTKIDVKDRDNTGITPLLNAVIWGHFETVKFLVESGANTEFKYDFKRF